MKKIIQSLRGCAKCGISKIIKAAARNLIIPVALTFLLGCATSNAPVDEAAAQAKRAQRLATVAELAAFTGTQVWLADHPEDRAYFAASSAALALLLDQGTANPQSFAQALAGLPIKQLQGKDGALIVGSAIILYDAYVRENVNIDANVYLHPVIIGVYEGLQRALAAPAIR